MFSQRSKIVGQADITFLLIWCKMKFTASPTKYSCQKCLIETNRAFSSNLQFIENTKERKRELNDTVSTLSVVHHIQCLSLQFQSPPPISRHCTLLGKTLLWLNLTFHSLSQLHEQQFMAGRKHTALLTGIILNLWPQTSSEPLGLLGNFTVLKPLKPLSSSSLTTEKLTSHFTEKWKQSLENFLAYPPQNLFCFQLYHKFSLSFSRVNKLIVLLGKANSSLLAPTST